MLILEPKPFSRVYNAKNLKNFLWDMKQYFIVAHTQNEQVTITTMYLSGDAKWCWCTRTSDDTESNKPHITRGKPKIKI